MAHDISTQLTGNAETVCSGDSLVNQTVFSIIMHVHAERGRRKKERAFFLPFPCAHAQ